MKVLFVCKANVGRSQIAEVFFNKFSNKHKATSAGTQVGSDEGKTLEHHSNVVNAMKELGIDISKNVKKQLTPKMVNDADKIVVITDKSSWPDYLLNSKKVVFWDVEDSKGMEYAHHCRMRDQVKALVEQLVKETR